MEYKEYHELPRKGVVFEKRIHLGWSKTFAILQVEDQWIKPSLRCHIPKIAQFVLGSEEGCGNGFFFPHPGVLVSLLQVEAPN